jgi:hypothetical protein
MPIKIIADYRELLIDIFFAIVIAVGLDRFLREFLIIYLNKLSSFDLESISKVFSVPIRFDIFFFIAAYFWVISHWVFYHELVSKYPYYRWRKFFVDITLFSIMFIVVNISFGVDKSAITLLFVWLLIVWYLFACLWHLSDRGLRPLRLYLKLHTWRLITYIPLLLLLYHARSIDQISHLYWYIIMIAVILAMILWSAHRLTRFLRKDSRVYLCDYLDGYPGRNLPYYGGRLELIKYPMSKKIGDKGKDIIKFEGDNFHSFRYCIYIYIYAEDIIDVDTERMSKSSNRSDLVLWIKSNFRQSDGTVNDIKVFFNLSDEIIASVREGIKELSERNKHGNSTWALR